MVISIAIFVFTRGQPSINGDSTIKMREGLNSTNWDWPVMKVGIRPTTNGALTG
jgi:hypothetical protein